ncbi:calcium uniporter protein 5, mitochondrial-like [Rutidosis leptorrhynchoides]|uniref:calcium uniporter protein 5, mitochondrial-like n=1 Tax=Rutidosis leptorrhynchoides TaxID=125765 RepID=UPI003A99FE4C
MWRSSFNKLLQQSLTSAAVSIRNPGLIRMVGFAELSNTRTCGCFYSSLVGGDGDVNRDQTNNVEALKKKLGAGGNEVVRYSEFLNACESIGVAMSVDEAKKIAKAYDDAGDIYIIRDKVYLHPHKVMDMVRKAIPLSLLTDNDPTKEELHKLQAKQEQIDKLAHKQVRCILWGGLGLLLTQASLFFRLTFWEFSWDVMEPITFFTTSSGLILGYAYFLFTSRDPSYEDFMKRLFLSRRRKLIKKHKFDVERFMELQKKFKPLDANCRGGSGNSNLFLRN